MNRWVSGMFLVILVMVYIAFVNLGGIPLLDPDEPVYAETPKEMMLANDFISPRIFGDFWYDKPPMYYWLVAGAFKLFGINEFAARFPSALLSVACVAVVYYAGVRLFNRRAGLAGALVLATSLEYLYLAKAAVTDITLTFFLTLSLLGFLLKKYWLFYLGAGLATVTKGPIGLLFPAGIVFFWLLATRRWSELRRMHIPLGIVLYMVSAVPWYWVMYTIHGTPFLDTFLGFHNLTRFTTPEHPEGVLWYYFIPVLIFGFFPWTPLLAQAIWSSLRHSRRETPVLIFFNIWAALIFIFFSISQTKLVSYILPMYPAIALLVGWYLDNLLSARIPGKFAWPAGTSFLALVFAGGGYYLYQTEPAAVIGVAAFSLTVMLMAGCVWYYCRRRRPQKAFWSQVIGMMALTTILMYLLFPPLTPKLSARAVAEAFTSVYDGHSPVYVIKFLRPGFAYYSSVYGQELKYGVDAAKVLARPQQAFFVLRRSDYDALSTADREKLTVLIELKDQILARQR